MTVTITTHDRMSGPEQETFDLRMGSQGEQVSSCERQYVTAKPPHVVETIAADIECQWNARVRF